MQIHPGYSSLLLPLELASRHVDFSPHLQCSSHNSLLLLMCKHAQVSLHFQKPFLNQFFLSLQTSWKSYLPFLQKTKIMASGPITSWEIDRETVEMVADFIFLGSKITADGDCSHEIKRCLLLGRKVMTNLDSIFKSRDITLPTNVRLVKAMVFPVIMYRCESWTVKKAEHWRIDAFELWCWRRLLRVPWTTRRSNQSILKEISPGISLEGLMLKLKLQYFGHLMRRVDSLKKTDAGRDWGQEEKGTTEDEMAGWHHWLDGRESQWSPGVGDGQGGLACCDSWGRKESDTTERLIWSDVHFKNMIYL